MKIHLAPSFARRDTGRMADRDSIKELEEWLKNRSQICASVLSFRTALRVLPVSVLEPSGKTLSDQASIFVKVSLRNLIATWSSMKQPSHLNARLIPLFASSSALKTLSEISVVNEGYNFHAAMASLKATNSLGGVDEMGAIKAAIQGFEKAFAPQHETVWPILRSDQRFFGSATDFLNPSNDEITSQELLAKPLWTKPLHRQVHKSLGLMFGLLKEQNLNLWAEWYQRRLDGNTQGFDLSADADREIQSRLLDQDNEWWGRGLESITRDIEAWIAELRPEPLVENELLEALPGNSSPEFVVTADGRLDAGPNSVTDVPFLDYDLADLPAILRGLIGTLLRSLPRNTPPVVSAALTDYQQHILERGAQPILGLLKPWMDAVVAEYGVIESDLWSAGCAKIIEQVFEAHERFITHFPLDVKREELIARAMFDEIAAAGPSVSHASAELAKATDELKSAGLTTSDFDAVAEAMKQQAKDYETLPRPLSMSAGEPLVNDLPTSPRKRFVFLRLANIIRLLNLGSSSTQIADSSAGRSAMDALRIARDILLALFKGD